MAFDQASADDDDDDADDDDYCSVKDRQVHDVYRAHRELSNTLPRLSEAWTPSIDCVHV